MYFIFSVSKTRFCGAQLLLTEMVTSVEGGFLVHQKDLINEWKWLHKEYIFISYKSQRKKWILFVSLRND